MKPVAWKWTLPDAKGLQMLTLDAEQVELARQYGRDVSPLYDQAALDAAVAAERERALRGEYICQKCGLRQDGYDAAGHAAAYPGF